MSTAAQRWTERQAKLMTGTKEFTEEKVQERAAALVEETGIPLETALAALADTFIDGYCSGQTALSDSIEKSEREQATEMMTLDGWVQE